MKAGSLFVELSKVLTIERGPPRIANELNFFGHVTKKKVTRVFLLYRRVPRKCLDTFGVPGPQKNIISNN